MLDEAQIHALLQGLPERAIRSGLEPYRELVLELRRRSFSYRQIAKLIVERCGFEISHSAIHDFVRKHGATPPSGKPSGSGEVPAALAPPANPERRGADSSIRERIEALKRHKPAPQAEGTDFRFDPAKPLHLED
jgi:hypothetical protein